MLHTQTGWIFTRFPRDSGRFPEEEERRGEDGGREGGMKSVGNGGDLFRRKKERASPPSREEILQGSSLVQVWPLIRQNCGKRETNHGRAWLSRPRICQLLPPEPFRLINRPLGARTCEIRLLEGEKVNVRKFLTKRPVIPLIHSTSPPTLTISPQFFLRIFQRFKQTFGKVDQFEIDLFFFVQTYTSPFESSILILSENNTDSFQPSPHSNLEKELLFFFANPIRAHSARSSAMASRSTISRDEIADGIPVRHRALAYLTVSSDRIPNPFFLQSATSSAFCFLKRLL